MDLFYQFDHLNIIKVFLSKHLLDYLDDLLALKSI